MTIRLLSRMVEQGQRSHSSMRNLMLIPILMMLRRLMLRLFYCKVPVGLVKRLTNVRMPTFYLIEPLEFQMESVGGMIMGSVLISSRCS